MLSLGLAAPTCPPDPSGATASPDEDINQDMDVTMTMATLTEDVSNHPRSSGPVGESGGVMTSRKKTSEI